MIPPPPGETSLRTRVVRSTAVNFGVSTMLKTLLFGQAVLYARVFGPAELGQLSTALLVVSFCLLFAQMGFNESIIRESDSPDRIMNTALTMSFLIGVVLFSLLFLAAPLFAILFHRAELTGYIRFLSFLTFGMSFGLPNLMWIRRFQFGFAKIATLVDLIVSTTVTILVHARTGAGVWSLLIGRSAGFVGQYITVWTFAPYRPRFAWNPTDAASLYRFGWPLMVSAICNYLINQGDDVLIRYHWGDATLAFYVLAFTLPFYLREFTDVLIASLLPTYAHLQHAQEKVVSAFLQADRYLTVAVIPFSLALFVFAEPMVRLVYGEKWVAAIPPLRIFALAFTVELSGGYSWGILALARGKTRYLMFVKLWIVGYLIVVGAYLIRTMGIMGGAYYTLSQTLITVTIVRSWILRHELGTLAYLLNSTRPLAAGIVAGAVILLTLGGRISTMPALLGAGAIYFAVYAILITMLDRKIFSEARQMARLVIAPGAGG